MTGGLIGLNTSCMVHSPCRKGILQAFSAQGRLPIHAPLPPSQLQSSSAKRSSARKAGYQGVPGAYSEVAALKACPDFDPMPCEQFETAFQV